MPLTTAAKNALALLLFNNTNWANVGDATGLRGSSAAGNFSLALFTADPTVSGSVADEADYTSYDRVDVARSGVGFTVTGGVISPAANVTFPTSTGGSNTITHWGICKDDVPGVADVIASGPVSPQVTVITTGVPILTTASTITLS